MLGNGFDRGIQWKRRNTSAIEVFSAEEHVEFMKIAGSTTGAYRPANA